MPTVDLTRIGSNIGAMYSLNSLMEINNKLATAQQRLSTGKRLNSAEDDPAGMTIATKMNATSDGYGIAMDNISDAKNMMSVAESGLSKLTDIITSMRDKAEQAASDTLGGSERATIQTQLSQYAQQIDDLVNQTKWNGVKLLDGTTGPKQFQTGVDEGENMTWKLPSLLDSSTLKLSTNVTTDVANAVAGARIGSGVGAFASVPGVLDNMSQAATGTYSVKVLDTANADGVTGKLNLSTGSVYNGGIVSAAATVGGATVPAEELASGNYTFQITGGAHLDTETQVNYQVTDAAGNVVAGETGVNMSAGTYALKLAAGAGHNVGVTVNVGAPGVGISNGTSFQFEYIGANDAKYELDDGSGGAMQVHANSATTGAAYGAGVSPTAYYGYYTMAAAAVDTGRGMSFTGNVVGNTTVGDKNQYQILRAGNHVVDVSNANVAAAYMTTANSALDVVNATLADLGSLMSRLTIKEDAASSAQINVQAAYSRIMNANMAQEQVNASKYQVLQQTAIAMLAQANQAPQALLSLFK